MFASIRRLIGQFFRKTRTINAEPLNKVSLILIVLIDLFILTNVFLGLNDISNWYISPSQAYPCYSSWSSYRTSTVPSKDYDLIRQVINDRSSFGESAQTRYQAGGVDHLGQVSSVCLDHGRYQDQVSQAEATTITTQIDQKQTEISRLEEANRIIREQYDSTLLEEIAGQDRNLSINNVPAAQAKAELDRNTQAIANLNAEIDTLKTNLLALPPVGEFFSFLDTASTFTQLEQDYQRATFWYPAIQFAFQTIFLLPLIVIAIVVHRGATARNSGLVALMSWHLLIIFCIPLVFKIFEFLQVGIIFNAVFEVIQYLFGGLLFLVSYLYILVIPLLGFGLIKFFQKIVFNPRAQAAGRVQKSSCIRCAKKLKPHDDYCPHCGFYQYTDCDHCHQLTYKYLPYCKHCGQPQRSPRPTT